MSAPDGLNLNTAAFDAAVLRLARTSKKAATQVMRDQARLLFVEVAKITPPYGGGISTGKKAEAQGKAAVSRDISSLYGTPNAAYDLIAAANPNAAKGFWKHHESGNEALAKEIMKDVTGKSFATFDGGTLHRRTAGGRRRRSGNRREPIFYVSNLKELDDYIAEQQTHVWWLASGWADALRALGSKLPYGVGKLNAPGRLKIEANDQRIVITMTNEVKFGREVKDIERRITYALNKRVDALDRRWNNYLNSAAKDAGFSSSL